MLSCAGVPSDRKLPRAPIPPLTPARTQALARTPTHPLARAPTRTHRRTPARTHARTHAHTSRTHVPAHVLTLSYPPAHDAPTRAHTRIEHAHARDLDFPAESMTYNILRDIQPRFRFDVPICVHRNAARSSPHDVQDARLPLRPILCYDEPAPASCPLRRCYAQA